MKIRFARFLLIFAVVFCSGCSGGGDDSGGGDGKSASTGIRVLHTAIDLPPVFVTSSLQPGEILDQVRYNENSLYAGLENGDQVATVEVPGGERFSFPITVSKGERRSVLIYGTRETFGIRGRLLEDAKPKIDDASAAIRIVNGVAGAASINSSIENGGESSVAFGGASEYIVVPAGTVSFRASRAIDGKNVTTVAVVLNPKKSYTLLLGGEVDYLVTTALLED